MEQQTVTLNPNESRVLSFQAIPSEAKTYHVSVDGLSGTFGCTEAPPVTARIIDMNPEIQYMDKCNFLIMNFTMENTGEVNINVKMIGWGRADSRYTPMPQSSLPAGTHKLYVKEYANTCDALNQQGWHTVTIGIELWEGATRYDKMEKTFDIYTPQTAV